jgi:hypothetical protein
MLQAAMLLKHWSPRAFDIHVPSGALTAPAKLMTIVAIVKGPGTPVKRYERGDALFRHDPIAEAENWTTRRYCCGNRLL